MLENKRLLILGAGRGQLGLIETANKMGINTIVGTLTDKTPPGTLIANEVCHMDILNANEVADKAKGLNLDGVATCCLDTGVTALGKTCDELNLVGLNENAAILCQDKLKMKTALIENGVSTAKFYKVSSEEELEESFKNLSMPVIVKATDLQGSKGIYIAKNEEEAVEGFKKVIAESKRSYCIVEEFIEGWEFGAQSFIYNGEVLFVMPHGDETYMSHTAVPIGHSVPLNCSADILEQTEQCVKDAIKALDLNNCAVNVDLIVKDGKVYIIELTGRVGANCLPELVSINYGINYYEMIALMAVGGDPKTIWEKRSKKTKAGLAKMIISENETGILKNIEYTGVKDNDILEITFFVKPGDQIRAFESSNDCLGQIIVMGNSLTECESKIEEINKRIVLDLM